MAAGSFNTGRLRFGYSGDPATHYRFYWGTSQGSWPTMETYVIATQEVDIHDVFPSAGRYYAKLKVWNGTDEFGDSGEVTIDADMGHFKLRR